MTWKQRKAASRKRSQVRKAGRDRRVGGLAAAIAYKATNTPKPLGPRRPTLAEIQSGLLQVQKSANGANRYG